MCHLSPCRKEYTNLVHVYDTETGQWRPTSTAPFPPRCHFASAFAGGKIWVIGEPSAAHFEARPAFDSLPVSHSINGSLLLG